MKFQCGVCWEPDGNHASWCPEPKKARGLVCRCVAQWPDNTRWCSLHEPKCPFYAIPHHYAGG